MGSEMCIRDSAYNTLIERLNDSDIHVDNIIIAKQNKETELVKL